MPRRRTGRLRIERTSTTIVAVRSSGLAAGTSALSTTSVASPSGASAQRTRPIVRGPTRASPSSAYGGRETTTRVCAVRRSPSGPRSRTVADRPSGATSAICVHRSMSRQWLDRSASRTKTTPGGAGTRPEAAITAGLLRRQQPPVARLPAVGDLDLDAVGHQRAHRVAVERRALAGDQRDQFGVAGQRLEHRGEGRLGLAPRDDLLVDKAHGLADAEAPLDVLARGGRHR